MKKTIRDHLVILLVVTVSMGLLTGCDEIAQISEEALQEVIEEEAQEESKQETAKEPEEDAAEETEEDPGEEADAVKDNGNGTDEQDTEEAVTEEAASEDTASQKGDSKIKKGRKISFKTIDISGNDITSDEIFSKHKVTMVNVWATWCGPCVNELAELDEINKRLADKNCAIVGLLGDVEDEYTIEEAINILEENDIEYLNILPWDGAIDKDFVIEEGWPTSYFVDSEGNLVGDPVIGAYTQEYERIIDYILGEL